MSIDFMLFIRHGKSTGNLPKELYDIYFVDYFGLFFLLMKRTMIIYKHFKTIKNRKNK